jgi:hypothetical protein
MACRMIAILISAAVASVAVTGCSTASALLGFPRHHPAPLTGVRLSALVPTPAGFTLDRSTSSDSGTHQLTPVPGASDTSGISCASWWSGAGYFGPGTVTYTALNYVGPDGITLHVTVNVYPAGTGAGMYESSVALQRRCRNFSYLDKDGVRYTVTATVGSSAGIGDRSAQVDATEVAPGGAVYTTQVTYVDVGDALLAATETGAASAPVNRAALPLAAIAAGLRSAGY